MGKASDKKIGIIVIAALLLILIAAIVIPAALCSSDSDYEDWIGPSSQTLPDLSSGDVEATTTTTTTTSSAGAETYVLPEFKPGSYLMTQQTDAVTNYYSGGSLLYTFSEQLIYYYALSIADTESGYSCEYRFDRVYIYQSEQYAGEELSGSVLLDTDVEGFYSEDSAGYFDLIGQSFTAFASQSGELTSIKGVAEIISTKPETASLISEESMSGLAGDLFCAMPEALISGQSWAGSGGSSYSFQKLSRGNLSFGISGEAQEGYSYEDSSTGGVIIDVTEQQAPTGALLISEGNRAIQELSMLQRSSGTMKYTDSGASFPFEYSCTTATSIVKK